ncbi:hypothetical protein T492DRAFT_936248 [Pavlovales sp. CCMP2436]|nr:hypothetical protein T492DRAFT_936248 [Pavlovales sp. CCMP2436]
MQTSDTSHWLADIGRAVYGPPQKDGRAPTRAHCEIKLEWSPPGSETSSWPRPRPGASLLVRSAAPRARPCRQDRCILVVSPLPPATVDARRALLAAAHL